MRIRALDERRGWFTLGAMIIKPATTAVASHTWIDGTKIPARGGCVIALNHISHVDPLFAAHFVYDHGRLPCYPAKASLFRVPLLGGLLRHTAQIPVQRASRSALGAYDSAMQAVIMADITTIVANLRDTSPPAERFDPRTSGVSEIGNPHLAAGRGGRQARQCDPSRGLVPEDSSEKEQRNG